MRGEKLYSGMLIRGAGRRLFTCALALFVSRGQVVAPFLLDPSCRGTWDEYFWANPSARSDWSGSDSAPVYAATTSPNAHPRAYS